MEVVEAPEATTQVLAVARCMAEGAAAAVPVHQASQGPVAAPISMHRAEAMGPMEQGSFAVTEAMEGHLR